MIKALRALAALFALLLAAFTNPALARHASHDHEAAAAPLVHPALWKVKGPQATIYLFGTIHALPKDVPWFNGAVKDAFDHSDELVTEIIEPDQKTMQAIVVSKAMLPAGQTLREMLTPASRRKLEAVLKANGLPPGKFDPFQPWFAAVALATWQVMEAGYDPANGADSQLTDKAKALGRPQEELETPEFQLGLFAALPMPLQKKYLMQVVKDLPGVKNELLGIIRAWKAGNAAKLAKLMNSDEDDPRMMQTLLIGRNKNWASWIQKRINDPASAHKTLFIAVGAGHLAGEGSVLDQLKALGIRSRRVQ